jgi:hypothetical protein
VSREGTGIVEIYFPELRGIMGKRIMAKSSGENYPGNGHGVTY